MFEEAFDWKELALRLGIALVAGAAIGYERQRAGKAAGLRTHMVVSLGACVFVLVPLEVHAGGEALSRAIQGVATGVGFLGAGEILHRVRDSDQRAVVKGLTSAAAIWLSAALGVVVACGMWRLLVLSVAAGLITLALAKPLEQALTPKRREDPSN